MTAPLDFFWLDGWEPFPDSPAEPAEGAVTVTDPNTSETTVD
jgi:hypothetical protein